MAYMRMQTEVQPKIQNPPLLGAITIYLCVCAEIRRQTAAGSTRKINIVPLIMSGAYTTR